MRRQHQGNRKTKDRTLMLSLSKHEMAQSPIRFFYKPQVRTA
jgi:hypothetical protein